MLGETRITARELRPGMLVVDQHTHGAVRTVQHRRRGRRVFVEFSSKLITYRADAVVAVMTWSGDPEGFWHNPWYRKAYA